MSVYLVFDSYSDYKEISAWFSWTPKKSFVVIEIHFGCKIYNNLFPLSILSHEFFHLILRKNADLIFQIKKIAEENSKLLKNIIKEHISKKMFIEELLISSFVPEGYASEKYFGIKITVYKSKPHNLLDWRRLIAVKLHDLEKKYINDARQIDNEYLKHLIEVVKQNVK